MHRCAWTHSMFCIPYHQSTHFHSFWACIALGCINGAFSCEREESDCKKAVPARLTDETECWKNNQNILILK